MAIDLNKPSPSLADIPSGIASRFGAASDVLSFGRNFWLLLGSAESAAFYGFALAGVTTMAASATFYMKSVLEDIYQAVKEEDSQSLKLHVFNSLPSALSFGTLSYSMVVARSADLAGAAQVAATAGSVVSVAAPILAACNIAGGYLQYTATGELKDSLDEQMGVTPKAGLSSERKIQAIQEWAKVHSEEISEEDAKEISNFNSSDQREQNTFIQRAHLQFLQTSLRDPTLRAQLVRKTSPECVEKIEKFFSSHISADLQQNLKDPATQMAIGQLFKEVNESFRLKRVVRQIGGCFGNVSEKNELERQIGTKHLAKIREIFSKDDLTVDNQLKIARKVYKGNYLANLKSRFMIFAGVIGVIGAIVGFVLTGGLAALPFVIGALVWITLDSSPVSKMVGNWFWKHRKSKILPQNLQKISDTPTMSEKEFWLKTAAATLLAPIWLIPTLFYLDGKKIHKRVVQYLAARELQRVQANPYQGLPRSISEADESESDDMLDQIGEVSSDSEDEKIGGDDTNSTISMDSIPRSPSGDEGEEEFLTPPDPEDPL